MVKKGEPDGVGTAGSPRVTKICDGDEIVIGVEGGGRPSGATSARGDHETASEYFGEEVDREARAGGDSEPKQTSLEEMGLTAVRPTWTGDVTETVVVEDHLSLRVAEPMTREQFEAETHFEDQWSATGYDAQDNPHAVNAVEADLDQWLSKVGNRVQHEKDRLEAEWTTTNCMEWLQSYSLWKMF